MSHFININNGPVDTDANGLTKWMTIRAGADSAFNNLKIHGTLLDSNDQPITGGGVTELGQLTDVDDTGVTNGQVLKWDSAQSKYVPLTIPQAEVLQLDQLADVEITNPQDHDYLQYDTASGNFINGKIDNTVINEVGAGDAGIVAGFTLPNVFDFKTFGSGDGSVTITDGPTTIDFSVPASVQLDGANVGGAVGEVFRDKVGNDLNFKTLSSVDTSVTVTNNADTVDLSVAIPNQADGANVGGAVGQVFRDKVGDNLNFKTLSSVDTSVTVTNNADTVDLTVVHPDQQNTGANVGGQTGELFRDKTGNTLNFKTIGSTSGKITVQNNADFINLNPSISVNDVIGLTSTAPTSGQALLYDGISNYVNSDLPNPTTNVDLKANAGIVLDTGELALDLNATSISGILAVPDGGTGRNTLDSNNLLAGNGTGSVLQIPPATAGHVLVSASPPTFGQLNLSSTNALTSQLPLSLGGTASSDYRIATETFSGKTINANANTLILGTNDLSDVLSVGVADNQILRYNQANLRYENEDLLLNGATEISGVIPLANGGTNSTDYRSASETLTNKTIDSSNNTLTIPVGGLSDVVNNTPLDNQIFQYNTTQYQNQYYQMPSDAEANILSNTAFRNQGVMVARNDAEELRVYQNGEYRYIPTFTKDNPWLNITDDFAPVVRFMPQNLSGTAGSFVWVDSISGVNQVNSQVTVGAAIGTYGSNPKNALELTTNDWIALNTVSPIVGNTDCTFYCVYQDFLNSGAGFGRILSCLNDISQADNLGNQNINILANGTGEDTSIFSRVTNILFDTPYLSETESAGQRVVLMFRYVQSTGQLLIKFNDVTYLTDTSSTGVDWLWNVFGFGKSIGVRTDGLTSIKVHESAIFDSALSESDMTEIYNRISFEYDTGYPAVSNQYVLNSLEDVSVSSPDAGTTLYYNPTTSNWNNFPMTMGSMYWEGNATFTTINTQNVWEKISGTSILKANMQFSMPLDNRLLYNGSTVIHTHIVSQYSAVASGNDRICEFSIFKNGVREVPLLSSNLHGTRVNGNALHSDFMMSNGDYVELYTRNTENTDNVLVTNFYIFILGMPVQT